MWAMIAKLRMWAESMNDAAVLILTVQTALETLELKITRALAFSTLRELMEHFPAGTN